MDTIYYTSHPQRNQVTRGKTGHIAYMTPMLITFLDSHASLAMTVKTKFWLLTIAQRPSLRTNVKQSRIYSNAHHINGDNTYTSEDVIVYPFSYKYLQFDEYHSKILVGRGKTKKHPRCINIL